MINLTATASLIKKYLGPLILSVLTLLFIFLILLRFINFGGKEDLPPLEKPQLNAYPPEITTIGTQNLKTPKNQPKKLPVYQTSQEGNLQESSQFFATKLGFKDKPRDIGDISLGSGKIYASEGGTLIVYRNVIIYQKNFKKAPFVLTNLDSLKTQAKNYFQNLGLATDLFLEPGISYSYILGESLQKTKDQGKANFINLTYNYSIEGIKTISPASPIEITMDATGNVIRASYGNLNLGTREENYPLVKANEALNLIKKGYGQIIDIKSDKYDISSQKTLPQIQLSEAYLAYYLPGNPQNIIQPVWVFEGEALIGKSQTSITIAIEAVKKEYFLPANPEFNP